MAKIHAIRRRIKSVQNIHQITKAMELVAASKLRRAQEAALHSRLYATTAREIVQDLEAIGTSLAHPLLLSPPVKNQTLIIFTSDRGLAGAYNTNVLRQVTRLLNSQPEQTFDAIVIGQKGAKFLNRLKGKLTLSGVYTNWPTQPTSADIRPIATTIMERFTNQTTDRVMLIYTNFVSLGKQEAKSDQLLPLTLPTPAPIPGYHDEFIFEPSPLQVLSYVLPRLVELQIYQAALEAAASEHIMRMMAMKNASDNAEDLTSDLTLAFNGARQAAITQELAEISSGAAAIN